MRISAGCFQALVLLKDLLNPLKNWRLAFQYVSHRVLRWTVCPILVPLLFFANALLFFGQDEVYYRVLFGLQCCFYLIAFAGWAMSGKKNFPKLFFIPYYFVFMNLSPYIGFYQFLTNKQSAIWKKVARKTFL